MMEKSLWEILPDEIRTFYRERGWEDIMEDVAVTGRSAFPVLQVWLRPAEDGRRVVHEWKQMRGQWLYTVYHGS